MNPRWRGSRPFNRYPLPQRGRPNSHGPRPTRGVRAYGYEYHEAGAGRERYNEKMYDNPPRVRKSKWPDLADQVPDSYEYERTEMDRGAHFHYRAPPRPLFPPSNYTDQVTLQYPKSAPITHQINEFSDKSYQEEKSNVGSWEDDQHGPRSTDGKSSHHERDEKTRNLGPESESGNQKKRKMAEGSNESTGNMKKKVCQFCEICNMLFISPEALDKHQNGLVHKQKLKDIEESQKKEAAKKDEEEDEEEEEDTSYCKYCNQSFTDAGSFYKHTRGMLHTQNLMAAESDKERKVSKEQGPFTTVTTKSAEEETKDIKCVPLPERDDEDNWMELDLKEEIPLEKRDYAPEDIVSKTDKFLHCKICNVTCSGKMPMRQHLEGAKHRLKAAKLNADDSAVVSKNMPNETQSKLIEVSTEALITKTLTQSKVPLIGLQYVTEFQPEEGNPRYVCNLCESKCDSNTLLPHLAGVKHRLKYFKFNHDDIYEHLWTYMSNRKKSELNISCEAFAAEVIEKDGQQKIKVKLEISQRSTMVAEAILKRSGVDVTDSSVAEFIKKKKDLKHVRDVDDSDEYVSPLKQPPKLERMEYEPQSDVSTVTRGQGKPLTATRDQGELSSATKDRRKPKDLAMYPYHLGGSDEYDNLEEDQYLRARKRKEQYDYDDGQSFWEKRQVFDYGHRDTSQKPSEKQVFEYDNKSLPIPGEKQVFDYNNEPLRPGEKQVFDYSNKSKLNKVQVNDKSDSAARQRKKLVFDYGDTEEMLDHDYRDKLSSPKNERKGFDMDYRKKQSKTDQKQESDLQKNHKDQSHKEHNVNSEEVTSEDDFEESERLFKEFMKWKKTAALSSISVDPSSTVTTVASAIESQTAIRPVTGKAAMPPATVTSQVNIPAAPHQLIQTMPYQVVQSAPQMIPGSSGQNPHQHLTPPAVQPFVQHMAPPPVQPLLQAPNLHMTRPPVQLLVQTPNQLQIQPPVQPLGQSSHQQHNQPPAQALVQAPYQQQTRLPVQPLIQAPNPQLAQASSHQLVQVPAPQPVPPPPKQPVLPSKKPGVKETEDITKKVNQMLGALSQTLIKSEDEAAMALQVSNALTQALLKFRLMKAPVQMEKSAKRDPQSQAIQEQNKIISQLAQHHMQNIAKEQQAKSHQTDKNKTQKSSPAETIPPPIASGMVPAHAMSLQSHGGLVPSSTRPLLLNQVQNTAHHAPSPVTSGNIAKRPAQVLPVPGHTRLPIGAQQFNAYSLRGGSQKEEMEAWKESLRRQALANTQSLEQPPLPEEMPPPPPRCPKEALPPLPKEPPPTQNRVYRPPFCMRIENVQNKEKQFHQPQNNRRPKS